MSDSVGDPDAHDADTGPVTIYDIQVAEDSKLRLQALPRLIQQAVRIAWAAGRREFIVSTLLQVIAGGGIALLLLIGQRGLQALVEAIQGGESLASVAPWVVGSLSFRESSHLSRQPSVNGRRSSVN